MMALWPALIETVSECITDQYTLLSWLYDTVHHCVGVVADVILYC